MGETSVCMAENSLRRLSPMALVPSAASALLKTLRSGDGVDIIRASHHVAWHDIVEVEAAVAIGAGRYRRTDDRTATIAGRDC